MHPTSKWLLTPCLPTALCVLILFTVTERGNPAEPSEAEKLGALLENVAAFESQYRDVEAEWRVLYRHDPEKHTKPSHDFIIESETTIRAIYQGEWTKEIERTTSKTLFGKSTEYRSERSDDGELFVNVGGAVVNHVLDRRAPRRAFRPHLMVFVTMDFENSLSTWLRGGDQDPSNPEEKGHRVLRWEGEGQWQGLRTVRVREERGPDAATAFCYQIEFVPDRSWLPVRVVSWDHRNKHLIASQEEVKEVKELTPGLWVPTHIEGTMSDQGSLRKGIQQTDRYYELRVTRLSASPNYSKTFFSEYTLPPDATIYEVKGGKIIRTLQRAAGEVVASERHWLRGWLPWAGGAAVLLSLIVTAWALRRRVRHAGP